MSHPSFQVSDLAKPQFLHVTAAEDFPESARGCVLAIGNFDGVHRGHQAVLEEVLALAGRYGAPAFALTFEPHPRTLFRPQDPVFRLTPEAEKARLFRSVGLNGDIVRRFDWDFAAQSADTFVDDILISRIRARHVVIGFDFHFGHNREGSPDFLREKARRTGLGVTVVEAYGDEAGDAVSSSAIRHALKEGDVADAAGLLGYRWFFSGAVAHGDKRGRGLGFPTANLRLGPECGLKHGIYAVRAEVDGKRHDGVASFGRRPTFDNGAPLFETFLFDFSGDLYGRTLTVGLFGFLRGEETFPSVEALVAQMDRDAAEARALLSSVTPLSAIDFDLHFS